MTFVMRIVSFVCQKINIYKKKNTVTSFPSPAGCADACSRVVRPTIVTNITDVANFSWNQQIIFHLIFFTFDILAIVKLCDYLKNDRQTVFSRNARTKLIYIFQIQMMMTTVRIVIDSFIILFKKWLTVQNKRFYVILIVWMFVYKSLVFVSFLECIITEVCLFVLSHFITLKNRPLSRDHFSWLTFSVCKQ